MTKKQNGAKQTETSSENMTENIIKKTKPKLGKDKKTTETAINQKSKKSKKSGESPMEITIKIGKKEILNTTKTTAKKTRSKK